jgi:alginate O-acetyltransferase complex protein AlgI
VLFNSAQFGLFFTVVYVATVLLPSRRVAGALLVASLLFYGLWVPKALAVLGFLLIANWGLARAMSTSARPKAFLVASVALTLSTLAAFKYGHGLVPLLASHVPFLGRVAQNVEWTTMPLGISFYSFEIISIAVDVHARRLPCPSLGRYALFVTFFPHLIAGPILRGSELLPQLERGGERTPARTRRGLWLFVAGLMKKVVLSDFLLQNLADEAFGNAGFASGPVHLLGVYAFAFQIYSDFSGYTDMARGMACVLGFELPMNFAEPYLSRSPSEFWRRWHMTLSRWLRDYLYVPLGGNRGGAGRTLANLVITMTLGGLWHGAGVNFIVWGALHGVLLVLYRVLGGGRRDEAGPFSPRDVPRALLCFNLVCLLWIPFRAPSFGVTTSYLRGLFQLRTYLHAWPVLSVCTVLGAASLHVLERAVRSRLPAIHARVASAVWGPALEGALLGACLTVAVLASGAGVQFIYFQF